MPHGFLQCLYQLWTLQIIEVPKIIDAIKAYGYELSYLDKRGIGIEKENEKLEYRNGGF